MLVRPHAVAVAVAFDSKTAVRRTGAAFGSRIACRKKIVAHGRVDWRRR